MLVLRSAPCGRSQLVPAQVRRAATAPRSGRLFPGVWAPLSATIVGKALTALLIFAMIVTSAAQLLPRGAGMKTPCDRMPISLTDLPSHSNHCEHPCEDRARGCMDCLGSLYVSAMPPFSRAATTLRWVVVTYSTVSHGHSGRSVKPELLPPISFA